MVGQSASALPQRKACLAAHPVAISGFPPHERAQEKAETANKTNESNNQGIHVLICFWPKCAEFKKKQAAP